MLARSAPTLGLTPLDPLNPWDLARQHGVEILSITELAAGDAAMKQTIARFLSSDNGSFSAMLLPVGLGVCVVENDSHAMTRRRSNICHEFGHLSWSMSSAMSASMIGAGPLTPPLRMKPCGSAVNS